MSGKLTLIPTPIDEESPLEPVALQLLKGAINQNSLFLVEDLKPGRRRWIRFGLPRETIEDFVAYNEHSWKALADELIEKLSQGTNLYLMSDGGMPAFCDPGRRLVDLAHQRGFSVSCTPFANSVIQALALSGFDHDRFVFEGFPPVKSPERQRFLTRIFDDKRTTIIMDTPYRLQRLLSDLVPFNGKRRQYFLACDLNGPEEILLRGSVEMMLKKLDKFKREFVLIIS